MKKILAFLLAAVMMFTLVACTGTPNDKTDDEPEEFDYMTSDLSEYITLGKFEDINATLQSTELSDKDFEDYMNNALSRYTTYERITDRAVEAGDTVVIDYIGEVEDETGATARDIEVVAADGNGYIPGFGSGIVGHMPGETFDLSLTYPDPMPNYPDFAGKPVVFHIAIHCIKSGEDIALSLDNLTDAITYEKFNYSSVEEFLADQREALELEKPYGVTQAMYGELWAQILDSSNVIKYPQKELQDQIDTMMKTYEYYASTAGLEVEEFFEQYDLSDDIVRENAEAAIKENLVMYSLIRAFDAEATEEDVTEKIEFLAKIYNATTDGIISNYGIDQLRKTTQFDKVMECVAEHCNITKADSTTGE